MCCRKIDFVTNILMDRIAQYLYIPWFWSTMQDCNVTVERYCTDMAPPKAARFPVIVALFKYNVTTSKIAKTPPINVISHS